MESKSFTLPSTPKLKKSNFSSSLISGAINLSPKINTSRIRISRPALARRINPEALVRKTNPESTTGVNPQQSSIENTLVETNKILVEIQKQLALDFAMRAREEKEEQNTVRRSQSRKKLKAEESLLEKSARKLGKGIKKTTGKIISPIKNVFDQILGFLLAVGAGIATNAAFEWLKNPENRKQLDEWFGWVAKNWKWVAGITAGVLLLQPILNIVGAIGGAIAIIKGGFDIFNFIRRRLFGGTPTPPGGRTRGTTPTNTKPSKTPKTRIRDPIQEVFRQRGQKGPPGTTSPGAANRYERRFGRSAAAKRFGTESANTTANRAKLSTRNLKPTVSGLSKAAKFAGPAIAVGAAGLDYKARKDAGQTDVQAASGAGGGLLASITAGALTAALIPEPTSTIGGLAVLGLIYGASTLGGIFGSTVADQITGVEQRERGGPMTAGKPYLVGEGGPELVVPKISGTVINNMKTEQIYQMISSDIGEGKINMIELPPITNQLPPPEISVPSGPASEVPDISSINIADPYRILSPSLYGITV